MLNVKSKQSKKDKDCLVHALQSSASAMQYKREHINVKNDNPLPDLLPLTAC